MGILVERPRLPRGVPCLYIHPGQFAVVTEPTQISTILGSCVAVCLWDEVARVGGMNHFVLTSQDAPDSDSPRVAGPACRSLLAKLVENGAYPSRLKAKIFGGSAMIAKTWEGSIGQRNVMAARAFLKEHEIPLISQDVGGPLGRKLIFEATSGIAWVRLINRANS